MEYVTSKKSLTQFTLMDEYLASSGSLEIPLTSIYLELLLTRLVRGDINVTINAAN